MAKHLLTVLIIATFFFVSCKSTKGIKGSATANPNLAVKTVLASHKQANTDFSTLAGRLYVSYEDAKNSQGIGVSLRMEKDKQIWLKASLLGATIAKVHITPTSVQYYETINNTYFDGDFSLLSEVLGTDIDFEKAQAILLGQALVSVKPNTTTMTVVTNKYKLQPRAAIDGFLYTLFLNPDTFKVHEQVIQQPAQNRNLQVLYGPYQSIEKQAFPTRIAIKALEGEAQTTIDIQYRKIDLNPSINFSFSIPEGYNPISL